jgi:meiotically up-regulated gene 157 (Mug157) protein
MKLTTLEVFPGLDSLISPQRFQRVDRAVQSLLTRTLQKTDGGLPFIITGDIPAMWLRDSTWQVKPLLQSHHPEVIELLVNLSKSQVQLFLIDPYANAFNSAPNGAGWHKDFPDQSPWVFERKFELDSWASILYLARKIQENFGVSDHLDSKFQQAVDVMLQLAKREQQHDPESYILKRSNQVPHDSLSHEGRGAPVGPTGMVYSAFRPSDDACVYGYLVPSNLFLMNELKNLIIDSHRGEAKSLAAEIEHGINEFAVIDGIYAYEVDGLGNTLFIDDANVPSLMSLPYLEVLSPDDPLYLSTREFVLSRQNPYFFSGTKAAGVGSQHTPKDHVWPIAIAITALTTTQIEDRIEALDLLEATDAGTGFMHESFNVNDDSIFTREWFSWSDMTYVDLVLSSVKYKF